MRSICFFASYFTSNNLPYYLKVYLVELKKHFNEVVLLSSQKKLSESSLQFLENEKITLNIEENEGFDFGMWYKAFQKFDLTSYDKIALINDSCVLFKSLDDFMLWSSTNLADLQGITKSEAIAPHIQSYFLVLNKEAIKHTQVYFNKNKVLNTISDVINTYEVGLSTYLITKGLVIDAYIDNNGYKGEFSPYYYCIDYHLSKGIPIIKKKVLFASYRKDELFTLARMNFKISIEHYHQLILKFNSNLILNFSLLKEDSNTRISFLNKSRYELTRLSLKILRPLYLLVKRA